jgi:hypothetical protein
MRPWTWRGTDGISPSASPRSGPVSASRSGGCEAWSPPCP